MPRTIVYAVAAVIAGGLGVGAYVALTGAGDGLSACREGGATVGADIGGDFSLTRADTGETVGPAELIDRPTLIYFGYTFCPDFCPLDGVNMAEAQRLLAERGVDIRTVFVTIDPARDTAAVVDSWTENLAPDMIGLVGSDAEIARAAKAYRVYYARAGEDEGDEFYLMDHSTFTYLMFPEIGFVDFFRHATPPEAIADRVACYAEALG